MHHAKLVCSQCGKFLGWLPKPETVKRRHDNAAILTALALIPNLPPWERQFIRDLASHKNISPRQQAKLLSLRDSLLGKEVAHDSFDGETLSPDRHPSD